MPLPRVRTSSRYIREAEAYTNEVQPRANGQAQRILEEARAYKTQPFWKPG